MVPAKVCCGLSLLLGGCAVGGVAGLCAFDDGKHRNRDCVIQSLKFRDSMFEQVMAEPMPPAVNAILLQEEFEVWDTQQAPVMQGFLKELLGFQYFAHARDTFANHLRGTWGILQAWGQPTDICRAGLFHTIYGGDLFIFSTLDPFQEEASRPRLRQVVDEEAEALTWDFGTLARGLVNASLHASRRATLEDHMSLHSFVGAAKNLTAKQIAKIMVVTMADYLDQLVEINLWRDFHSHEPSPFLYPGTMKPEVALYWISRVCKGIKDHLEVVPPIFDHCTLEIAYEAEREARDLYWQVISDTHSMGVSLQVDLLQGAVRRNPFIAEPHIYLAELHFQRGDFNDCVDELRTALRLFYNMGTHWDKRVPFRQWVSHSRLLLVRCVRRMEGKPSMPLTKDGVVLTTELVEEMERVSPIRRYLNVSTSDHVEKPIIFSPEHA